MLCQFSITNYKCIKDEITFNMQATNISEHEGSLIISNDGEKFLPLGVIYGPNGSGKSTVLDALYTFLSKVMRPICAVSCDNKECAKRSEKSSITPFLFDGVSFKKPTRLELNFRTDKNEYWYEIDISKDKIISEELYKKEIVGKQFSTLFVRKGSSFELKNSFKGYKCNELSDNLPLLSFLCITHKRNSSIKDILNWIENEIEFINYGDPISDLRIAVSSSEKVKNLVLKMMKEMDIDIADYRTEEKENLKIFTSHIVDNESYELELNNESNGTIKVFGMLPYIANSLINGTTLVVDELDAKLHPLLLKYIINLYSNPEINKKGAQLIFTSHDLSNMNSEMFRRDEIWFIAKGKNQSSSLYSLIEFKNNDGRMERKDARYDKRYLEGRYGADPYLRRIIDWGEY